MHEGCDMIVNLKDIPKISCEEEFNNNGIKIKRAFPGDKRRILDFVKENFNEGWIYEAEHAILSDVPKCFIATCDGKVVGFACFDSSAKGFFGPIGVDPSMRGKKIGEALLIRTLNAMKEYGYWYAIIGWVSDAEKFYRKTVGAEFIQNGTPENSVYSNMVQM